MIEFKADCGHTVRAKNEDEGKIVRCSYCGREASVPVQQVEDKDLDFLFREMAQHPGAAEQPSKPAKKRRRQKRLAAFPSSDVADPFRIALKMVYAAVILMILIVVGKMYVLPLISNWGGSSKSDSSAEQAAQAATEAAPPAANTAGFLYRLDPGKSGILVDSVPEGARIYVVPRRERQVTTDSAAAFAADVLRNPSYDRNRKTRADVDVSEPGAYGVLCTLPVNDPGLKSYPQYREFRQGVEGQTPVTVTVNDFLMQDKAVSAGAIEFRDDFLVYRIYEVDVAPNEWSQVVALFLPPQEIKDTLNYLPPQRLYAFDQNEARSEMTYYEFPKMDQSYLINALERIGGMTYHLREGRQVGHYWLSVPLASGTVKIRPLVSRPGGAGRRSG